MRSPHATGLRRRDELSLHGRPRRLWVSTSAEVATLASGSQATAEITAAPDFTLNLGVPTGPAGVTSSPHASHARAGLAGHGGPCAGCWGLTTWPVVVEAGEWTGGDVVISKGLASGDQVIVDGVVKLGPGAPIQISAPAPAGQAAPASNAKQGG